MQADIELRLWLAITRNFPPIRGAGIFKRIYNRKKRPPVIAEVNGVLMELDPAEDVESALLFTPQLCDAREFAFMKSRMRHGDTFIDVGSCVGSYAYFAARLVGPEGRVVAIDADPDNFKQLKRNGELNGFRNTTLVHSGVFDSDIVMMLSPNPGKNRGGSSFVNMHADGKRVEVRCRPLLDILKEAGVERINGMKLDVEGCEFVTLRKFFGDAEENMHPEFLIFEELEEREYTGGTTEDMMELLKKNGYKVIEKDRSNFIMEKSQSDNRKS